jgi:hypothetical protein
MKGERCGCAWGGITNGIRLRQATRLSSPNVLRRDRPYGTHETNGDSSRGDSMNAARQFIAWKGDKERTRPAGTVWSVSPHLFNASD